MSVLICGLSLPKMPEHMEQGQEVPYTDVRIFADGSAITTCGKRPYYEEYRAIELPPHDRLIDADVFLARNAYFADREFVNPKYDDTLKDLIDRADTIIPAELEDMKGEKI